MTRAGRGMGAPGLLVEAVLVVFAVLVALGVDEWREDREIAALVANAEAAVAAELRSNRDEVRIGRTSVQAMHDSVAGWVRRIQAGGSVSKQFLGGEIPEFSDAAWETARVTGALAHMPYERVLSTARAYDTQELAGAAQGRIFEGIGGLVARGLDPDVLIELQGRLFIALQIYAGLEDKYDQVLEPSPGLR